MPVLDATLLFDLARRPEATKRVLERLLAEDEPLVVPAQAAIEYASGERDPAAALRALAASYEVVACDASVALEAARVARLARDRGRFPGWGDVQVAATAIRWGMYVASRDKRHLHEALGARVWDYAAEPEPPAP